MTDILSQKNLIKYNRLNLQNNLEGKISIFYFFSSSQSIYQNKAK